MLGQPGEIELILMAVVGAVVALATLLPTVAELLGYSRVVVVELPETPEPAANARDPVYRHYAGQLERLGFDPLGTCIERHLFNGPLWVSTTRLQVFGSRERECFACIRSVALRAPAGVAVATCFDDSGLVWTSNYSAAPAWDEADDVRQIAVLNNLQQFLHRHRRAVEVFRAQGRKPEDHSRLLTLVAAIQRHAATTARNARASSRNWLWLALTFQVGFPLLVAFEADWHPLAIPVAILIGAGLYWTTYAGRLAELQLQRVNEYNAAGVEE